MSSDSGSGEVKAKRKGLSIKTQVYYVGFFEPAYLHYLLVSDGEFLVRKAEKTDDCCGKELCVLRGSIIHRVPIRRSSQGKYYIAEPQFGSIPALVTFYVLNRMSVVDGADCLLRIPFQGSRWALVNSSVIITAPLKPDKGDDCLIWKGTMQRHSRKKPKPVFIRAAHVSCPVTTADEVEVYKRCRKLSQLRHDHVVGFIGMTIGWSTAKLVSELCDTNLHTYLTSNAGGTSPSHKVLYCYQIACGVQYLVSEKLLPRVLKTSRCMLKNGSVKVGGLDCDVLADCQAFSNPQEEPPYRWMAPESLNDGSITEASIVWSYGVTCWETVWDGALPFPEVEEDEEPWLVRFRLINLFTSGYRMRFPYCESLTISQLFESCFLERPQLRPDFNCILTRLRIATGMQDRGY